jgi:hypothetical protein
MCQGRTTTAAPLKNRARRARGWWVALGLIVALAHATVNLSTARADASEAAANETVAPSNSVPIDTSLIAPISFADTPQWRYIPDPAPTSTLTSSARIVIPGTGNIGDEVETVLLAPGATQAVVVSKRGGATGHKSYVCNYGTGAIDAVWEGTDELPICVSRDGTRVLCQTSTGKGRAKIELVVYELNGGKAKPLVAWKPYSQQSSSEVQWAAFVDSDKVVTLSTGGAIALWDVSSLHPVWTGKVDDKAIVALSGGRNTLAIAAEAGVKLINVGDGRVVGVITTPMKDPQSLAFSADGKRLAACSGWLRDQILVWNLADGRVDRDFGLIGHISGKQLDWADDTHLLISGSVLVDVDRRVEIWRFTNVGESKNNFAVDAGRLWFVNSGLAQAATLGSLTIPTRQALGSVSKLKPEQLVVLQPGSEVALELSGDGDVNGAREALAKQLTEKDIKIVPKSSTRLVGQVKVLPAQRVRVRNFGQPQLSATEYEFTPRVALLSLFVDNELVWQRASHFGPSGSVDVKDGESIDQALVRLTKADVMSLTNFEIPRYLSRIP